LFSLITKRHAARRDEPYSPPIPATSVHDRIGALRIFALKRLKSPEGRWRPKKPEKPILSGFFAVEAKIPG
jgi:hypothetical protein